MLRWTAEKGWGVVMALGAIERTTPTMLQVCLRTHTAH